MKIYFFWVILPFIYVSLGALAYDPEEDNTRAKKWLCVIWPALYLRTLADAFGFMGKGMFQFIKGLFVQEPR